MCIALAPVGMTKSIAAAMLRANKRLSFFFMVNHSFPHHFGAEPKTGKHSVHKFKLPDKISCEKRKTFWTVPKGAQNTGIRRIPNSLRQLSSIDGAIALQGRSSGFGIIKTGYLPIRLRTVTSFRFLLRYSSGDCAGLSRLPYSQRDWHNIP